ncbi:MAG TPA: hypothetical protein VKR24_05940 [Candidatus Limnocylindrales bacterium]|nr:hypothetical protein [Candidatus Limnocylindrales bacterium]
MRNRGSYLTFEHMHQLCFHLEFEHQSDGLPLDPDAPCKDPRCPALILLKEPVASYDAPTSEGAS